MPARPLDLRGQGCNDDTHRPNIFIFEGIPGAGKDTCMRQMLRNLHPDQRPVHVFDEDALLFSWKHYQLPDMDRQRMSLMESMIAYIDEVLAEDSDAVFLLNRFHISFALSNQTPSLVRRYARLLDQLRALRILVIVPVLREDDLYRVRHPERRELAWRRFLGWRQESASEPSMEAFYARQQERILALLREQGLPYVLERIAPPAAPTRRGGRSTSADRVVSRSVPSSTR